ncbi:MAG: hypothetical protein DRQ10_01660 [Candidatus Hydrothermota bacterium]|nr:MAG: hypothetical protein DRQ10_01660 [Candidatus Hydrothermae bacterium]
MKAKDVDAFMDLVETLDEMFPGEKFLLLITYQAPPHVRRYVKDSGVNLVFSHELPLMSL